MPIIPLAEEKVATVEPKVSAPSMPAPVPGAFGGDISRAQAETGNIVKNLALDYANYQIREAHIKAQENNDNLLMQYSQAQQDALLNDKTETIARADGTTFDRPVGVLNRHLDQAQGSTVEFDTKMKTLKQQILDNVKDPHYKAQLTGQIDRSWMGVRDNVIQHEAKQKNDNSRDKLAQFVDSQTNSYPMQDQNGKNQIITLVTDRINSAYKNGLYDFEQAEKAKEGFYTTLVRNDIYGDNATEENQSNTLAQLRKGSKGDYKYLPETIRLKMIEESQRRIFQNNQTYKKQITDNQNQRQDNLIDKFASGTATLQDIENELALPENQGGIKREVLLNYQRGLQRGIEKDLNKMLTEKTADKDPTERAQKVGQYLTLIDSFIDDKTDIWHAREKLAQAYSDGVLNAKEQQFLHNMSKDLKTIEQNRSTAPIATAVKALKNWHWFWMHENPSDEEMAVDIKKLLYGVQQGTNPQDMINKITQDRVKTKIPSSVTFSEKGRLMVDKNGNRAIVYPDGRVEEVK